MIPHPMPPNPVSTERFQQNETAFFLRQVEDLWNRWQSQPVDNGAKPRRYLILSTPRTGSTMLAERLNATGKLGYVHEWLNWEFMMHTIRRFGHGELPLADYIRIIDRATTSSTGIFGVNIHVHQVRSWLAKGFDIFSLGFERVYWLARTDRSAQAYSWAKAFKTKCWSRQMEIALGFTNGLQIEITPLETARFLTAICDDTTYYRNHITSARQIDREFYYEELAADRCHHAVTTISADFDVAVSPIDTVSPEPAALGQSGVQSQDHDRLQLAEIKKFFGMKRSQSPDSTGDASPEPRKAYFDFGAHHGAGLRQMTKILGIDASWDIHLFEPNPHTDTRASLADYPYPFHFYRAAIWSISGTIEFLPQAMIDERCPVVMSAQGYIRQPIFDGMGSAVAVAGSCEPGLGRVRVPVEAVGIAEALSRTSAREIYIKMDIEASEYEVLTALLRSPVASSVQEAYVEWHKTQDGQEAIKKERLTAAAPFPIHDWH